MTEDCRGGVGYLLIEDSLSDAALLEVSLREGRSWPSMGIHRCQTLGNGLESLALEHFDLIFLDLNLPDSDGIDTFRALHSAAPDTPIIVLTATVGEELAAQAMEEGAQDVIFKDRLDPYWIAHAIRRASSRHLLLQRIRLAEDREVQAVKRASQAKTDFLSAMSHEIRTPLGAMIMATEILIAEGNLSGEQVSMLEMSRRSGGHLLALLNDALDLSRVESGRLSIESRSVEVRSEVEDIAAVFLPLAREKGLELETNFDADVPEFLWTDPTRFRQVLSNLVANAIKFTEIGSVAINVGVDVGTTAGSSVSIRVTDSGIGLTQEEAATLFRPFSQADASIVRRFGGSGLGLSLSKNLAEALGGGLALLGCTPGEGSTFVFSLAHTEVPASGVLR